MNEFWSGFRIHPASVTGSKGNKEFIRRTEDEIFARVMGREPKGYDRACSFGYRMLRHLRNPADTWERILRGPVFGRETQRHKAD